MDLLINLYLFSIVLNIIGMVRMFNIDAINKGISTVEEVLYQFKGEFLHKVLLLTGMLVIASVPVYPLYILKCHSK